MSNLVPISDIERMAAAAAKSRLFGFKTTEEAMAIMLLCQAENLHPGIAMRDYHVINGRPTLKADAILARFQQAGGKVEWVKLSDTEVTGTFTHPAGGSATITWTFEAAQKIGLTGKDNWKKYPRAMLRSRVVSEGVRTVYPGVVVGTYSVEEGQDMEPASTVTRTEPIIEAEFTREADIEAETLQWPIMVPGQEQPYTRVATAEVWVMEMNEMALRIRNSSKVHEDERQPKLDKLRDANQHIIEALPEELRNGLSF